MINRRDYLKESLALSTLPVAAFAINRDEKHLTADNANTRSKKNRQSSPYTTVGAITRVGTSLPPLTQLVPSNNGVRHRVEWVTVGEEGPEALRELRQNTTHKFLIDKQKIENSDSFWSIHSYGDKWGLRWEYLTGPKPIGEHSFEVRITVDHPFETKHPEGMTILESPRHYIGNYEMMR